MLLKGISRPFHFDQFVTGSGWENNKIREPTAVVPQVPEHSGEDGIKMVCRNPFQTKIQYRFIQHPPVDKVIDDRKFTSKRRTDSMYVISGPERPKTLVYL